MLTLNKFHRLFWRFYGWLETTQRYITVPKSKDNTTTSMHVFSSDFIFKFEQLFVRYVAV